MARHVRARSSTDLERMNGCFAGVENVRLCEGLINDEACPREVVNG